MENLYLQRARRYLDDPSVHYNCAQSVLLAFAPECGLSEDIANKLGTHFGSGMKMASVCGAITGALMVIGMLGGGSEEYQALMSAVRGNHDNKVNCADLLKKNAETGQSKKVHCDNMVYETVSLVAKIMHLCEET